MGGIKIICAAVLLAGAATAQQQRPTFGLYGDSGGIEMPTALMQPDARLSFTAGGFDGTLRSTLTFQAGPRIEIGFRYASVERGQADGMGGLEDSFDPAFDLKFLLLEDRGVLPAVALGFRDLLGNGLYASEYLVASKTVYGVTGSVGLGWGRLGGLGSFDNPFEGGDRTVPGLDTGGNFNAAGLFSGDEIGVFAGLAWQTPIDGLTFKAEYSSDAYDAEVASGNYTRSNRFNFGLEYRPIDAAGFGFYWLNGEQLAIRLSISADPRRPVSPPDVPPGPAQFVRRADDAPRGRSWANSADNIGLLGDGLEAALAGEGIDLISAKFTADRVDLEIVNQRYPRDPKAIGRTMRILAVGVPASVEVFSVTLVEDGLPTTTVVEERSTLEAQINQPRATAQSWASIQLDEGEILRGPGTWTADRFPVFSWSLRPTAQLALFDSDSADGQLRVKARARIRFSRQASLNAEISQRLLGEIDPQPDTGSSLERVRADAGLYSDNDFPLIERLTADMVAKLADGVYGRASAGILERQYAGVSGEVLWKPASSPIGFGVEVNYVRARDFDDPFALLTNSSVTGLGADQVAPLSAYPTEGITTAFASLYWDTGFHGVHAQVDAGQYLAGDVGATVTLSRRFSNGWEVGAFVTMTDANGREFGEGSFDRGVAITIPFNWALPFETRSAATAELGSLTRDGGARLDIQNRLYPMVRGSGRPALRENWGSFWQ